MTFLSRILGFVRDIVAAYLFGAGPGYDAFVVAFRIPNLMRRLFAEGAFSQAFVPMISEYRVSRSHHETQVFINRVTGNLALVLLAVTCIGIITAPIWVWIFAPGFKLDGQRFLLASEMLRWTFPYIFFIALTALAGGILNSYGRFGVPALTPIFLNICLISAGLWLAPQLEIPEMALAVAVLAAGVVQLGFQLPFLRQVHLLPKPSCCWHDPGVKKLLTLMAPALLGAAVGQINLLVDSVFASFLPIGSVSWLYYSDRLMEFPLGVFGVGFATVILPQLSRQHTHQQEEAFYETLDWGIRCVLLVGVPAMLGLALLAGPLLCTLFQVGKFGAEDVWMSRQSLVAYALAVVGIMLGKVLANAFYARKDIKTPVKFSCITLVANVFLNALFIGPLAHAGLALATSLASLLNASLLYWQLKKIGYRSQTKWTGFFLQLIVANIILIGVIVLMTADLQQWIDWSIQLRVFNLAMIISASGSAYCLTLLLMGFKIKSLLVKTM